MVKRKVFVPEAGGLARYLEIMTNPNPIDVKQRVRIQCRFADNSDSGDLSTTFSPQQPYALFRDQSSTSTPLTALVMGGPPGSAALPTPSLMAFPSGWNSAYNWQWNSVTVPANGSLCLMHFVVQAPPDAIDLDQRAQDLMNLVNPAAYNDLTAEERSCVGNFVIPAP